MLGNVGVDECLVQYQGVLYQRGEGCHNLLVSQLPRQHSTHGIVLEVGGILQKLAYSLPGYNLP